MRRFINSIIVVGILVGLILPGYSTRAELTTTTAALSHRQESKELYSHGSPIVEELELQHEAGSEGEYETATSPRTISRRLSHRMNADRVLHMRSRTSTKKTAMKAKKPAAAKKPPSAAAAKKASSTKSKSAASSSASTAASPSSLTGTKSKDEVFSHFIVAFRKGYKDLATAKAKQATVKANTAKIDALNKRIRNNEPPVAQLVKSDVATATSAAAGSSSSSSTKKTNTKAKAKATTTRGKARFADVEMDAPKKTTAASKSSKSSTKSASKSAKSSKSSSSSSAKSSSSSSSRKKKAVEATPAERSIAKAKLKPVSRRTAKQQQQRKLGRAVFGVNRFTDLTPAQFKAKYANSQPASQIVLAVKTKGEKKMNKMKSKKIPRRGVKSSSSSKSSTSKSSSSSSSSSKKQKSTTTASAKTKKRSLIELAVNGPPPAKPPAPKTSSTNTGGVTAASFANSNVAGGPSKPTTKTSSSSTSGVSASSFGNSNVGGGPAKTTTKTSSSNTGGTTSASFGNSNVGGGPSKPGTKTSSSSTSGTSSSSFGNSNVGGGPNDQGSAAAAAAPADDPVASAVAISPAGTWSDDEIADFQAQARLTPNVPYRKFNDFVDQPCDWSGVIPVVRATSGCGACWAVTTADAIQAAYFRTYGKGLKQVSSQGIMDCNFNAYNGGCKGGSLANAINSIIDNSVARKVNGGEVYFESDYPYRYNTDADAMHQQCKPKSGSPQSLVSTWAWAIPPAKMAVVDMTGYTRALQELEIAKQKGAVAEAGSAKVEKQKLELQAQSAAADKALANREEQIAALTKATEDEVEAGSKKLNDMNAECRRLDSVRSSVLPPQLDAKMKQAIDQRDAARTAFYAYEKTDPYQGANRKDPVKYQQMRDLWTQAEDNVKAVSKSNDDALRAASDAASKCRSDVSTYQTNWNQQRTQMIADLHAKIQSLPSSQSVVESYTQPISNEIKATVDANMKQYNSFVTMTAAELMDSFSGYASLSYGWYTNPEYVEVMSMQVSAEEKREILLARALNKYGPLAVIINAAELNSYAGGILQATDMMCSSAPEKGDHAIMLVGLAKDPATNRQYWILKNSWGTDWGNNGYLYLARGQNTCGLANAPARVAIKGDANDPVAVQQDAQIAAFLAGQPSSYTARE